MLYMLKIDLAFAPKHVTSLRVPSPHHIPKATQLLA